MSTKSKALPKQEITISPASQALLALAGAVFLFFVFVGFTALGYNLYHAGRIFPGVTVGGVDLSERQPADAAALLASRVSFPESGKIVFQAGQNVWAVRPVDLGLVFDANTTAQAAYELGRHGNPVGRILARLDAWYGGKSLAPLLAYDENKARAYVSAIAAQIDQPTIEASLKLNGADVIALPGQVGRRVDISATLKYLEAQMRAMQDGIVPIEIVETPPEVLDASQQAELARQMLSAPLVLQIPDAQDGDPGPWRIEPQQLAEMLAIERVESAGDMQYRVGLKPNALNTYLEALAPATAQSRANARFVFNDETRQLELLRPALVGRTLNVPASLAAINEALARGEHTVNLSLDYTSPDVPSDATAQQLGITELISSHTSYFRGSSVSRIQNIEAASERFHGLLVPPGATFSAAEAIGDVSLDSGFAEALIIYGGRTIKGVGGGVCQVSTTLFRTAFLAGFPIVERYPHAYRVGYYEQTAQGWDENLAGLDATVFVPVVDLKFVNDSPNWLLMETYINPKAGRLTWKFYSTSDGRVVDWSSSGPQNVVEPPEPLYEENPDLAAGEIKQVDWAAEGADVVVSRVVRRGGEVLFTDEFVTQYQPWRDVFQYGPGTDINGKKKNRD